MPTISMKRRTKRTISSMYHRCSQDASVKDLQLYTLIHYHADSGHNITIVSRVSPRTHSRLINEDNISQLLSCPRMVFFAPRFDTWSKRNADHWSLDTMSCFIRPLVNSILKTKIPEDGEFINKFSDCHPPFAPCC
ncbi:hypothetical protein TNCV_170551 [Trichonephila clavipes]|nr:hypothetical protein TNCV_170551 [Trichonephila clavipes]